jgi:hypothetical protein
VPTVTNVARATTKDGAVWRTCVGCGVLAALAPEIDRCNDCVPAPRPGGSRSARRAVELRSEHFAAGVADDGRLFRSERGNVVGASTYSRI